MLFTMIINNYKANNCINFKQDTRRLVRQLFFLSSQCKVFKYSQTVVVRGGPVSYGPAFLTLSADSAPDPRLLLPHWLHLVTNHIFCSTDMEILVQVA